MNPPRLSIIVPAFNEAGTIGICIRAIQANPLPRDAYEILVADNGSTDATALTAEQLGAKVIDCRRAPSIAAVRNMGAAAAQGPMLLFLDADVMIPENFLESALRWFDGHPVGVVGFVDEVPPQAGWVGRTWGDAPALRRSRVMAVDNLPSRNLLVSRPVFERVGGFDASLETGEDKDFCMRTAGAGFTVISAPGPRPLHLGYDPDLRTFIRKEFWRQSGAFPLALRHGFSRRSLRHPLMCLWHLAWGTAVAAVPTITGSVHGVWLPLVLWLLPSAIVALKTVRGRRPMGFTARFFLLTFIRWNVAAAALLRQLATVGNWRHLRGGGVRK